MLIKIVGISILVAGFAIIFYFIRNKNPFVLDSSPKNLFTAEELRQFNGIDKPELYLAILGKIFNVTKGSKHYGPGGGYNFFIGKDSSRSFITGKFTESDINDDVSNLTHEELRSIKHWVEFYGREYTKVGKLIGRYYNENGKLTRYGKEIKQLIKIAAEAKDLQDLEKIKYPPCNVEWFPDQGSRVWCTKRSGGITRNWIGKPRQYYESGAKDHRCACVENPEVTANFKEYAGCDSNSYECFVKI